jgi:hypothetical protein
MSTRTTTSSAETVVRDAASRIGLNDLTKVDCVCQKMRLEFVKEDWQLPAIDSSQWKELRAPIGLVAAIRVKMDQPNTAMTFPTTSSTNNILATGTTVTNNNHRGTPNTTHPIVYKPITAITIPPNTTKKNHAGTITNRTIITQTPNTNQQPSNSSFRAFLHKPDRMMYKVPEDWAFPRCNLERAFQYWHCGDPYAGICPFQRFTGMDVKNVTRGRKNLHDFKAVLSPINIEAQRLKLLPEYMFATSVLTPDQASAIFKQCRGVMDFRSWDGSCGEADSTTTPTTGKVTKKRYALERLLWSSVLRQMTKRRKTHA